MKLLLPMLITSCLLGFTNSVAADVIPETLLWKAVSLHDIRLNLLEAEMQRVEAKAAGHPP